MKKSITLIELMVVIVVLGILTAIAIPNIKNIKSQATLNGAIENKTNVQKGIDRYLLEKQEFPTTVQPTVGHPQSIDWVKLEPPFLMQKPQDLDRFYYWIDSFGTVWMSDIDSPTGLGLSGATVTFNENPNASSYQVGYIENDAFRSISEINAGGKGYNWSKKGQINDGNFTASNGKVSVDIPDDLTGKTLVANVVSKNGLETAPVSVGYTGSTLEVPVGEKPTAVITMTPNSGIDTTTSITWSSADSTDPKGRAIVQEEWDNKQNTYSVGNQTVKLRVKNDKGYWSDWTSVTFNVALGNQKPIAIITMTPETGLTSSSSIAWNYGSSSDPDGDTIVEAEWTLDGTVVPNPNGTQSGGNHTMQLRVKDSKGAWSNYANKNFSVAMDYTQTMSDYTISLTPQYTSSTVGTFTIPSGATNATFTFTLDRPGYYGLEIRLNGTYKVSISQPILQPRTLLLGTDAYDLGANTYQVRNLSSGDYTVTTFQTNGDGYSTGTMSNITIKYTQ